MLPSVSLRIDAMLISSPSDSQPYETHGETAMPTKYPEQDQQRSPIDIKPNAAYATLCTRVRFKSPAALDTRYDTSTVAPLYTAQLRVESANPSFSGVCRGINDVPGTACTEEHQPWLEPWHQLYSTEPNLNACARHVLLTSPYLTHPHRKMRKLDSVTNAVKRLPPGGSQDDDTPMVVTE